MTCRIHWCKEAESSLSVVNYCWKERNPTTSNQLIWQHTKFNEFAGFLPSISLAPRVVVATHIRANLAEVSQFSPTNSPSIGKSSPTSTRWVRQQVALDTHIHWDADLPSPQAPKPPKQRSAQRRVSKSTHASPTWTFTSRVAGRGFSSDAISYAKTSKTKAFRKCNTSVGACFQHAKNMQWQYDRWSNYDLYHLVDWEVCKGYLLPTTRTYHYNVVFVKEHSPPTSIDAPQKPIPYSYIAMNFVGTPGFSCLDVPPRCEQDASIQAVLEWHGYPFQNRWSNSASRKAGKHIDICT